MATGQPTEDAIRRLAHSYWEARGKQGGSAEQDWLEAERQLKRELMAPAPAAPQMPVMPRGSD